MVERKCLMVDLEIADNIKSIARRYGMTISGYLRELFREVFEVEKRGIYAPSIIRRAMILKNLKRVGFGYLPIDAIRDIDLAKLEAISARTAMLVRSLGIDPRDLIDELVESIPMTIEEGSRIVIPVDLGGSYRNIVEIVKTIARYLGYRVEESDTVVILSL